MYAPNDCLKISKTFIAYPEAVLPLTPYQSARDCSTNVLASANFEKSLEQLNKLKEEALQWFLQRKMKRWPEDFPQMVQADCRTRRKG